MTPPELAKTVYLGDRACKSLLLDGWHDRVSIQVTCISRVRDPSGNWGFYTAEDIEDGLLVLTGVRGFKMTPSDAIPNDIINYLEVASLAENPPDSGAPLWRFKLSIDSVDQNAVSTEVITEVLAADLHLEDPSMPGKEIRT